MGKIFRFMGILAGGVSVFLLASTWFDFELSAGLETVIGYYQALVYPIVGVLEVPLEWLLGTAGSKLSESWREWTVLYMYVAGDQYRRYRDTEWGGSTEEEEQFAHVFNLPVTRILLSLFWPLGIWIDSIAVSIHVRSNEEDLRQFALQHKKLKSPFLVGLLLDVFLIVINFIWVLMVTFFLFYFNDPF